MADSASILHQPAAPRGEGQPTAAAVEGLLSGLPGDALSALRRRGEASFRAQGIPTRRVEAWRYTAVGLNAIAKAQYRAQAAVPALDSVPLGQALALEGAYAIVLVNGRFSETLSTVEAAPAGLTVMPVSQALAQGNAEGLGDLLPLDGLPFAALNTAVFSDGLVVHVAPRAMIERPLHVVSIAVPAEGGEALAVHPRLLVTVGEGASMTLAESHVGLPGDIFVNLVSEIRVEAGATLTHALLQNQDKAALHIAATQATVAAEGTYRRFALSFGARMARDEIRVSLDGEKALAQVDGAYGASGTQIIETASFIDHAVADTNSNQVYKGVLDDTARGVFQGRVNIRRDAQCCKGNQLHKALLLSRGAEVDTKPELTIYADDVKCSHGAAAGELDENALFYLRARGIDAETARTLLIEGFLDDVIDGLTDGQVKDAMIEKVGGWLRGRMGGE